MKRIFFVILYVNFLGACGPSFTNPVLAPVASLESLQIKSNTKAQGQFYLKSFEDIRKDPTLVEYDGEKYRTDSDLTLVVREALSRILVKSGYVSSKTSAIFIKGKLIEWKSEVKDGYPGALVTTVKVYLELLDPTDRRIYSGTYSGQSELQAPSLNNEDLRTALSLGMEKALEQVARDKGFVSILNSF